MRYRWAILFLALASTDQPTWGYEEVSVLEGGTLVGTITLDGKQPRPKGYNLITLPDPVYCGRISDGHGWRLLQPFNVGKNGQFRDVVIYLENIEKGKPFSQLQAPRIEAKDCQFLPFTNVVREKETVVVVNMDPVIHDIQAYETSKLGPRVLFNIPLPMNPQHPRDIKDRSDAALYHKHLAGEPMKQLVGMTKGRRVFVMQCGFHAYMESWGLAMENPYYAHTDSEGRFEISDIPPGTYNLVAWHPYLHDIKTQIITIKPKTQATVALTILAPVGRLYANEMASNPSHRLPHKEEIEPTLILQEP